MLAIAARRNFITRLPFHGQCLVQRIPTYLYLSDDNSLSHSDGYWTATNQRVSGQEMHFLNLRSLSARKSSTFLPHATSSKRQPCKLSSNASFELKTDKDVVWFNFENDVDSKKKIEDAVVKGGSWKKVTETGRKVKKSKKAKENELRFYRLKARKKMKSPNPGVRIQYKLGKAKRKEAWLIEKLMKFEVAKAPAEAHDPEILTEEERFYLKRTGEKKKHYVPVGRRGVFGGVVLNMHLHWKRHETVKVVCRPCKPGQIHEYVAELARLSKGVVIDIKPDNTVIFFRGKNYVQPDIMCPTDTLSKAKALERYKFEQSLEHTSQYVEKMEKELEEYHEHFARYQRRIHRKTQPSLGM